MSRPPPRVSIGLPVYNGEPYLAQALDSLQAQTFGDFELIICDNASTDCTGEIARSYAAADSRIRYVKNDRNLGWIRNFIRSFELSSGEYFRWHAADDLSAPECQERCVQALDREPTVVLAYPRTRFIDARGRRLAEPDDGLDLQSPRASRRFREIVTRLGHTNLQYGLMRAAAVRRTRMLGLYPASDMVFLAELTLYGRFWEVPEFLFYRRFHPGASSSMNRMQLQMFYDPIHPDRMWIREWRHLGEYLRAAWRAPLGSRERLLLHLFLTRLAIGKRGKLARELLGAARYVLTGRRPAPTPGTVKGA